MSDSSVSMVPSDIQSIMGLIDTYTIWKSRSKGPRGYEIYHPSAFGKCLRLMQYLRYAERGYIKVVEEDFPPKLIRLFDKGHNMHERWAKYAEGIGILRGYWRSIETGKIYGKDDPLGCFKPDIKDEHFEYMEVSVKNEEMNFSGHADMIWDFSNFKENKFEGVDNQFSIDLLPKKPIVVDMKTCNDRKFDRLLKTGPSLDYKVQLTIYANILPVEYGLLIYENKNDSNIAAYKITKNPKMYETIRSQALTMNEMVDKKLLPPPRPESKDNYECSNCPFKQMCHSSKIWDDPNLEDKRKKFYKNLM